MLLPGILTAGSCDARATDERRPRDAAAGAGAGALSSALGRAVAKRRRVLRAARGNGLWREGIIARGKGCARNRPAAPRPRANRFRPELRNDRHRRRQIVTEPA